MNMHEFALLPKEKQLSAIWDLGVAIGEREDYRNYYTLYSIDSFYVELKYYGESLVSFCCFKHTTPLEPYLKDISINAIVA